MCPFVAQLCSCCVLEEFTLSEEKQKSSAIGKALLFSMVTCAAPPLACFLVDPFYDAFVSRPLLRAPGPAPSAKPQRCLISQR
jgi:hypothetical protein